jgi:hypothetical protein
MPTSLSAILLGVQLIICKYLIDHFLWCARVTHAYHCHYSYALSKNMRIVFNLAFCGNVAGNRFMTECPDEAAKFNVTNDPVKTCNAYIESDPETLKDEAYWKIRGVYVYERELEQKPKKADQKDDIQ